jgi:ABC-type multidrug transport system fused ATPase/permease subunit
MNYKTVTSFGENNTDAIFKKFEILMEEPLNKNVKNAHIAGFIFGYSQSSRMIFMGIIFWIGSVVIVQWGYAPEDVYIAI